MELATMISGGLIVAAMAFLGSSILGFLATGIFAYVGAVLAWIVAWPLSYFLVRTFWRLDAGAS